jgi:hypothetical protein
MECRHRPRGDTFATGGGAATATDTDLRCLAGRDVGLGAFDVAELERGELPLAEQRFDVRLFQSPPAIVESGAPATN